MKNILTVVVALGMMHTGFAQKSVTIEGSFSGEKRAEVKLYKEDEGTPKIFATSQPSAKGKFGFNFTPDYEGLYLVGTGDTRSPQGNFKFWFKPGDKLNIVLNDSSYSLAGTTNSKENIVLTDWFKLSWPIEWKSVYFSRNHSTYVDFFPILEKTVPKAKSWAKAQKLKPTGNKKFDAMLPYIADFDMTFFAINFLNTPRSAHPDKAEIPEIYSQFNLKNTFSNASKVYAQPWGLRAFATTLMRAQGANADDKSIKEPYGIDAGINLIPNDSLKGDFVLQRIQGTRDYGKYLEEVEKYGKYLVTYKQKDQEFKINTEKATLKPGDKGLDFKYEDKDGKMVSFSDLKGKVVLIDTWATWCGPCKVEIPHLKKLEEEMKGKNVHIVSISVDEEKDKDKWKKMIADENLGGIQLFASGWSDITKYYKITGIPRFMLFDKEGKIITVDAPRPSSPDLKPLIEKYL